MDQAIQLCLARNVGFPKSYFSIYFIASYQKVRKKRIDSQRDWECVSSHTIGLDGSLRANGDKVANRDKSEIDRGVPNCLARGLPFHPDDNFCIECGVKRPLLIEHAQTHAIRISDFGEDSAEQRRSLETKSSTGDEEERRRL